MPPIRPILLVLNVGKVRSSFRCKRKWHVHATPIAMLPSDLMNDDAFATPIYSPVVYNGYCPDNYFCWSPWSGKMSERNYVWSR